MVKERTFRVAIVLLIIILAFIIAWGTDHYYGQRQDDLQQLLPAEVQHSAHGHRSFPMEHEGEIDFDPDSIDQPRFADSSFSFISGDDSYIYLNLQGNPLIADYDFKLILDASSASTASTVSLVLGQESAEGRKYYESNPIKLEHDQRQLEIDLTTLPFTARETGETQQYGVDFTRADLLRIDFNAPDAGTLFSLHDVRILSGVTYSLSAETLFNRGTVDGLVLNADSGALIPETDGKAGKLITHAIGLGSIESLENIDLFGKRKGIAVDLRFGSPGQGEQIDWQEWQETAGNETGLAELSPGVYIQFRLRFSGKSSPDQHLTGLSWRVIDPTPPGIHGPLFGTSHLPTWHTDANLSEFADTEGGPWARLAFSQTSPDVIDSLIARDVNIIASLDLATLDREAVLAGIERFGNRILIWEITSDLDHYPARFLANLFAEIRAINPLIIILPERIDSTYFQGLALKGLEELLEQQPLTEEILNRGFWWYFILAAVSLFFVISLGPIIGYNFNFGLKEIKDTVIALGLSVVIIVPLMLLSGFASLTLPRDLPQLQIAFGRYVFSSFLQEFFLRALLILVPVKYLIEAGLGEKKSWLITVVGTSVIFGLTHLGYPGLGAFDVFIFILITSVAGLLLGWLFYRNRSLTAVWIAHLIFNIFMSTMTTIGPRI